MASVSMGARDQSKLSDRCDDGLVPTLMAIDSAYLGHNDMSDHATKVRMHETTFSPLPFKRPKSQILNATETCNMYEISKWT
jgi:hypothetical protein